MSLASWIGKIPKDKKDHGILGRIIGFPLVFIGIIAGLCLFEDKVLGMLIGGNSGAVFAHLLFSIGKEVIHDWLLGRGNPEVLDAVASSLPVIEYQLILNLILVFLYIS